MTKKWTKLDHFCAPIAFAGLIWFFGGIYLGGANGFALLTGVLLVGVSISIDLIGRFYHSIFKPKEDK